MKFLTKIFEKFEHKCNKNCQMSNCKMVVKKVVVGSVVERLKHRTGDQHCLGSKSTLVVLFCPWERHFRHFPLLGGPGKHF